MELKLLSRAVNQTEVNAFNRTIVELKLESQEFTTSPRGAFNRTIVELKREIEVAKKLGIPPLIVP